MSKKRQTRLADLALELGLSIATVSRALKNYPDISQGTKQKVLELAHSWNYHPNGMAAGLRNNESKLIGVIVPEISNQFFSLVIKGIMEVAYDEGYRVLLCQSDESYEKEVANVNALLTGNVDGVLVSIAHGTQVFDHFREFKQAELPLVFFDKITDEIPACSKVIVDDYAGAYGAVCHLIDQGFDKIAHIKGPLLSYTARNRFAGYRDALLAHNIPVESQLILDAVSMTVEEGILLGKLVAQHKKRVNAVFAVTDLMAIGLQHGLKQAGIRIPDDIAVMGFNDWFLNELMDPPISSVQQPGYEMGKIATEILIEEINAIRDEKPFAYQTITLPTQLIPRTSTLRRR